MPLKWKLFRLICVLQIIVTACHAGYSLINIFLSASPFLQLLNAGAFILILFLANLGLSLMTHNYPNEPLSDSQKTKFNQLFLINFFLLAFTSGHVFAEYRRLDNLATFTGAYSYLPYTTYLRMLIYIIVFIFHILILYGLFQLRKLLYAILLLKDRPG